MSSIFVVEPVVLDIAAMRTGLGWAQSWATSPILCKVGDGWMRLIVAEEDGFLAAWSWPLPDAKQPQFFLIPPFVASTLSGPAAWQADKLEVMTSKNVVGFVLRTGKDEFRLQWRWDARDFKAPREFGLMSQLPDTMLSAPYVSLADVIHLAIANMINPALAGIQQDGAILIDFTPGQINIDGASITPGGQSRYYFNPRMLIRGLEIVRERQVGFAIVNTGQGHESILYLSSQREGWQVHCALLSVGVSTEAIPSMRIRETRPPMEGGSWLKDKRPGTTGTS